MIITNKRLLTIAQYISQNKKNQNIDVIDIGSDHAFLSIQLIDQNIANYVLNVEIATEPMENGISNIKQYCTNPSLIDNVIYGSEKFYQLINRDFDTVTISGLGGNKIAELVVNYVQLFKKNKHNFNQFIVCMNNKVFYFRKYLFDNLPELKIKEETIIEENGYFYEILILSKENGIGANNELTQYFGPINLKKRTNLFYKMHNNRKQYIESHSLDQFNQKLKKELKLLYEVIK